MSSRERLFGPERSWRTFGGVAITSGVLALAGCGGSNKVETVTETVENTQPAPATTTNAGTEVPFIFDSLGSKISKGGSNVINVYAGPKATDTDRQSIGTYMSGQLATGECKEVGREVQSSPSAGELQRQSDEWIHIHSSGAEMWATAVYIKDPSEVLKQLPNC